MRYEWRDQNTDRHITVERKMDNYTVPPSWGECKNAGWTDKEYNKAKFVRIVTGGIGTIGFGEKGNW